MRLYPEDAYQKLGYDDIRQRLAQLCLSDEGKETALALEPQDAFDVVHIALRQTHEYRQLLDSGQPLPMQSIPSVAFLLRKAAVPGNYITEEEALKVLRWLEVVRKVKAYLEARAEVAPSLMLLMEGLEFDFRLIARIEEVVDRNGRMLDSASPVLKRLRVSLIERGNAVRQALDRMLRHARAQGWADDRDLTLRGERLVLPMHAEAKNKLPGIIHDVSSTGHTVYLEPLEAVELNNEIRELRLRERNEVVRILTELTDSIRPMIPLFTRFVDFLSAVDLLSGKAKLAQLMGGVLPALERKLEKVEVVEARHPVLVLRLGRDKVVPLTLRLTPDRKVLVISGPNAGGKSIALKTLGLLQVMLQAGLLVPCSADARFGLFQQVFVDIGDDQSVLNDLSTYSSHLAHMREMLTLLDRRSLFLIDEFGTGTDPQLGGPMAEAMLERFLSAGAYGAVTTHYSNLKDFATRDQRCANAAMLFDTETLQPTYRLSQGLPGSSFTFEMAQRAGIPPDLIAQAKEKAGATRSGADALLVDLKKQEAELQSTLARAALREQELNSLVATQKQAVREAQTKRTELLEKARQEAADKLRKANARIEQTIREIKEAQADKQVTKQLRKDLEKELILAPVVDEEAFPVPEVVEQAGEAFAEGDWVKLPGSDFPAQVLELRDSRALVALGELQITVDRSDLIKVQHVKKSGGKGSNVRQIQRAATAKRELDLRGQRVEAALAEVDRFMDQALLGGLDELVILHGKGSGALRQAIRDHLSKNYHQVRHMMDGPAQGGGAGITIVQLAG